MRVPWLVGIIALVLSSLTHGHEAGAELRYRIVKLDTNGDAFAINNQGTIGGTTRIEGRETPVLWRRSGVIIGLPLRVADLNDLGQVVGNLVRTDMIQHGFVWTRGRLRDIGDLPGGADRSGAADINNRGQVVGSSATVAGFEAILWEHGNLMSLGDLPGGATNSGAAAINELGTVVGTGSTARGFRAFVWRNGVMRQLRLPPELQQAASAGASDINQSGVIVGGAGGGIGIPLVWPSRNKEALVLPIPTLFTDAIASAVNDRGDIVGTAFIVEEGSDEPTSAVIWRNGKVSRLNALIVDDDPLRSCINLVSASGINERGEIAATGFDDCVAPEFSVPCTCRLSSDHAF